MRHKPWVFGVIWAMHTPNTNFEAIVECVANGLIKWYEGYTHRLRTKHIVFIIMTVGLLLL